MDFWFHNSKPWFVLNKLFCLHCWKGVRFERYYILAGPAELIIHYLFHTPRYLPSDLGRMVSSPNGMKWGSWDEEINHSGDYLYSHTGIATEHSEWRVPEWKLFLLRITLKLEFPPLLCKILVWLSDQLCTFVLFRP